MVAGKWISKSRAENPCVSVLNVFKSIYNQYWVLFVHHIGFIFSRTSAKYQRNSWISEGNVSNMRQLTEAVDAYCTEEFSSNSNQTAPNIMFDIPTAWRKNEVCVHHSLLWNMWTLTFRHIQIANQDKNLVMQCIQALSGIIKLSIFGTAIRDDFKWNWSSYRSFLSYCDKHLSEMDYLKRRRMGTLVESIIWFLDGDRIKCVLQSTVRKRWRWPHDWKSLNTSPEIICH